MCVSFSGNAVKRYQVPKIRLKYCYFTLLYPLGPPCWKFARARYRKLSSHPMMHVVVSVLFLHWLLYRFGEVAFDSIDVTAALTSTPTCHVPDMFSYLETLLRLQETSSALQVVHTLATVLHMPDDAQSAILGSSCVDSTLRGRLFDVVETMFVDGQLLEQHTQVRVFPVGSWS